MRRAEPAARVIVNDLARLGRDGGHWHRIEWKNRFPMARRIGNYRVGRELHLSEPVLSAESTDWAEHMS